MILIEQTCCCCDGGRIIECNGRWPVRLFWVLLFVQLLFGGGAICGCGWLG